MVVKAEIRDLDGLSKRRIKILIPLFVWFFILISDVIFIGNVGKYVDEIILNICVLIMLMCLIVFIPMVVIMLVKANKGYKETWLTKEFDFQAINNHIYLNDKKMHVNYNKVAKKIYIHDMGDYDQPYQLTFYATIKEPDVHMFLKYIKDNAVQIEKEHLPRVSGKYGSLAPLSISQYRR